MQIFVEDLLTRRSALRELSVFSYDTYIRPQMLRSVILSLGQAKARSATFYDRLGPVT